MVDIKKVRMAKGLISIMVIKVKELNMVVQIRLDSLGFSFVIVNIQLLGYNVWFIIYINNFLIKGKYLCYIRL